jgi:peptidoglycan/LPS O-acetylase OafA/YrhL
MLSARSKLRTIDDLLAKHNGRVPCFNAMRFLAASAVLAAHSFAAAENRASSIVDPLGTLGLFVFFLISGFLIAQSCTKSTPGPYLIKRAARIMPGLILVTLFCALLLGPLLTSNPLRDYFTNPVFFKFFLNILFVPNGELPGVFQHNLSGDQINISLWTLRYEVLCYVTILAVTATENFSKYLIGVLAVGLSIVAYPTFADLGTKCLADAEQLLGLNMAYLFKEGISLVSCFFVGALYYFLRAYIVVNAAGLFLSVAIMAIIISLELTFPLFPFTLGYTVIYLGLLDDKFFKLCRNNDYSYGMYIFAFPVQQTLVALALGGMTWWMNLSLAFPIVLALAALSWHLVERPSIRFARSLDAGLVARNAWSHAQDPERLRDR